MNSDGHLFQLCSLKWNVLTIFFVLKSQNAKDKHQNKDWDNLSYKDSHILGVIYILSAKCLQFSTMAQWSCCCTLTFRILHFEVLTFWNVKFLIGFLDELGNFKQKKFTFQNANFFTFYSNGPKNYVAWVFFLYKYGKFWSLSLEQKVELKPLFYEECHRNICVCI